MVPAQTGQPPHPVPSFHKHQQKLLTSLPPLSIATSLTSKGLGLPKKLNAQPSKSCSPEETISFWSIQPRAWNLLYWGGERAPDLTWTCSIVPLCAPCGSYQPEQPAQPILTSQLTCQILLGNSGNSGTEWLKTIPWMKITEHFLLPWWLILTQQSALGFFHPGWAGCLQSLCWVTARESKLWYGSCWDECTRLLERKKNSPSPPFTD